MLFFLFPQALGRVKLIEDTGEGMRTVPWQNFESLMNDICLLSSTCVHDHRFLLGQGKLWVKPPPVTTLSLRSSINKSLIPKTRRLRNLGRNKRVVSGLCHCPIVRFVSHPLMPWASGANSITHRGYYQARGVPSLTAILYYG